jgi:ATP-dependent DNA helicase DinG
MLKENYSILKKNGLVSKKKLEEIFGNNGWLSKKIQGFRVRPQQLSMATSIQETIKNQQWLIAEAATGTGKTFAYLVPALLSAKKILISTATKNLQDQLILKDLPKILSVLGISRTIQNLKGRDNYLCKYHIQRILTESSSYQLPRYKEIIQIYEQIPHLSVGEKNEIRGIAPDDVLWQGITAHSEHCLASKCPMQSECFLYQARQKAMAADCVVVNHHLFFADSRLKEDGFGALLPAFEIMIFDEAHQLVDIATQFYSQSFSTAQLLRIATDIQSVSALPIQVILESAKALENSVNYFLRDAENIVTAQEINKQKLPFDAWAELLNQLLQALAQLPVDSELKLLHWKERLGDLIQLINSCATKNPNGVAWLKPLKRHIRFQWSPFSVSEQVRDLLTELKASLIFTSATLQTAGHFSWFQDALGLENAKTMSWESPYNWSEQAMLYIPHDLPDVYHELYYMKFIQKVLPIIKQLQGRTFILFTSHRALQWVAQELSKVCPYPLFVQGNEEKAALLSSFREHGNGVLLGTGSFWEGVDVQGQALSCVAIDKLPFLNISEPLVAAKLKYLKASGKSIFDDYLIPQAILALKQGVGRLLRTEEDKGVLIIGDPRLIGRPYGRQFKESLPELHWTRSETKISSFIDSFQQTNEALEVI